MAQSEQNHPSSPNRLPDPPPSEVPHKRAPVEEPPKRTPPEIDPPRDPEEPSDVPEKAPTDPDIAEKGPIEAVYWISARPHERYDSFEAANF